MRRDGKRSWFHELNSLGDVIRELPVGQSAIPASAATQDEIKSAAQAKRDRKAAKRLKERTCTSN